MSFPAKMDFERDDRVTFARWRVYVKYCCTELSFTPPKPVKVWPLVQTLHLSKPTVIEALDWLVAAGYLEEHGRDEVGTRQMTLTYARRFSTLTPSAA